MEDFPIEEIDPFISFPSLAEIPQKPKRLYIRGSLEQIKNKKVIAIVGSRACTSYGTNACRTLIEGLRGYNVVIVSGLAMGIDAVAHKVALENNLTTIAFPGSGLSWKTIYPAINKGLAKEILNHGGALISEYEAETKGAIWTFPQRNRLVAGIADIVIVIEAQEKSGALITARLGTEYNKIVGALPGSIYNDSSKGANWLLRLGAVPITSSADILQELGLQAKDVPIEALLLNEKESKVLEALNEPKTKDAIIEEVGITSAEANVVFSTLEIKGLIKETYGLVERIA
ncbi:MAG: DNA-processing protein DprA [Candidatus Pacebacteria bacterium]|nr:DNA-processing protein DprA [Candidatus Paceibacterota bacterium]